MENDKKPGVPLDDDMANELEVLRLMQGFQSGEKTEPSPSPEPARPGYTEPACPAPETGAQAAPAKRRPLDVLLGALSNVIPKRGDAPLEIVRKCVFLVALIVLIGSVSYIINDMVIIPTHNADMYSKLGDMYNPNNPGEPDPKYADFDYPEGMDPAFKNLYPLNTDLRGWITYNSDAKSDFLKINYPILYSGDNEKYLTEDFYHNKGNKNGALFFDYRNVIDNPDSHNKVSIVYGHNMASGQMFSGLNKFINSVYNVRSAPLITMNTLYHRNQYKVFAVVMTDEDEKEERFYFRYLRTKFSGDADFLNFVSELRAHSMYDYNSVDVQADDDLLILSTCTGKSVLENGRLAVIARRVRDGESAVVDTRKIDKNDDVIMPKHWYEKQNLPLHAFYTDANYVIPTVTVTTSDSTGNGTATYPVIGPTGTTPTGSTAATTRGSGTTAASGVTTKPGTTAPVKPVDPTGGEPTDPTQKPEDTTAPTPAPSEPTKEETTAPTDAPTEPTEPPEQTEPTAES